jgi:ABC-2 type transport system permease protein
LPSRSAAWRWLLAKEWRELLASRAFWILLLLMGPLVGVCFIGAAQTYAEASGLNGTSAGVGEAFSPLVGVWGPTFSACELAAAFLLPFVAIRVVAGDLMSGSAKLESQHPMPTLLRLCAKALVLLACWALALAAPLTAVLLWTSYGGTLHAPEIAALVIGHLLNALLTIGLATVAAAWTRHPSTAAILTLAVTVGTWILDFVAAIHGGAWERAAQYTPTALVAEFQHGLVRVDATLVALALAATGLLLATVWLRPGVPVRRRLSESVTVLAVSVAAVGASLLAHRRFDLSEDRANSFTRPDEEALRRLPGPLRVEAHLAPADPRRLDLETHALQKLRRVRSDVEVTYVSATSIGLFEQTAPHYGEIWYDLGGRRAMSRATTAEGVLETLYELAGVPEPAKTEADIFRGHPLPRPPTGAAWVFYGVWPALVAGSAFIVTRRQ